MRSGLFKLNFCLIAGICLLMACQKEIDGSTDGGVLPLSQKPKVGTKWTYRYYIYNQDGSLNSSSIVVHKAKAELTLGGEQWLEIVEMNTDTTVYILNEKTGGLYQFTNSSSNLFCKFPAVLNDTYSTFNEGSTEDFIVTGANDSLPTGVGVVPVNSYDGYKGTELIDQIWYNEYAWIVRKTQYRNRSLIIPVFYKYYSFFLDEIEY